MSSPATSEMGALPGFGRVEVEASIFGESALIDRVCCYYHSFAGTVRLCLIIIYHWIFLRMFSRMQWDDAANGKSLLGMWQFKYLAREPDAQTGSVRG
jgi:hypothetical protein